MNAPFLPPPPGFEPPDPSTTNQPAHQPAAPPMISTGTPRPHAGFGGTQPPPGYVAYGSAQATFVGRLQNTTGLRNATTVLLWAITVLWFVSALGQFRRKWIWDDPTTTFADLDAADNAVITVDLLSTAVLIAAGIVLCLWSLRAVRNVQKLGNSGVEPRRACWGWFVPIGNVFVPFTQLRVAAEWVGASVDHVRIWQASWGIMVAIGLVRRFGVNSATVRDQSQMSSALGTESWTSLLTACVAVVAAYGAMRSMKSIDAAVAAKHLS